jgi:hypothetical protein
MMMIKIVVVVVVVVVVAAMGLFSFRLSMNPVNLDLRENLINEIRKAVLLQTCYIVGKKFKCHLEDWEKVPFGRFFYRGIKILNKILIKLMSRMD